LRSSDIPVGGGGVSDGGLPLGLVDAGLRKSERSERSDPSQPPEELRRLPPDLVGLALLVVDERPGGLPRRAEPCVDDTPRLVFAYWRVLFFPLFLRC
jgi:hypothetical protein